MDPTQAWNSRREGLEEDVIAAVKKLLTHSHGATSFVTAEGITVEAIAHEPPSAR
jgi:hypothetical protein